MKRVEGVVEIINDFYAKTPEALKSLLSELERVGYSIGRPREDYRGGFFWIANPYYFGLLNLIEGEEYKGNPCIFETWHWAPLTPSPKLHETIIGAVGLVSNCGYYSCGGRGPVFGQFHLDEMRLFVEHFTTLDIKEWDKMVEKDNVRIGTIAHFCHDHPEIDNRPNIGSIIVGLEKITSGQKLTTDENDAMADAYKDTKTREEFLNLVKLAKKEK